MHRFAGSLVVFVIYLFVGTCTGQQSGDAVGLHLFYNKSTDDLQLHVTLLRSGAALNLASLQCKLEVPAAPHPQHLLKVDESKFVKNDNPSILPVDFGNLTGNVQCIYDDRYKSNIVIVRPKKIFLAVITGKNLTMEKLQKIFNANDTSVKRISADPLVFHVERDKYLLTPKGDYAQLNLFQNKITADMEIKSTRYCPPVPELQILIEPIKPYFPSNMKYTFGDFKLKCEGDFYTGVSWNKKDIEESLNKLRLLAFQNSTLTTINDVRNFSEALIANDFVHERELPVLANKFNELQISNVLNDSKTRLNISNELIANAETKIHKMPLTENVTQEIRDNFFVRVENISQTNMTGMMLVDTNENAEKNFQNVSSLNENTNIKLLFKESPRLGISLPDEILGVIRKISYIAYRNMSALTGSGKCPITSVISATVDDAHQKEFKKPVKVWFRREAGYSPGMCVYWKFSAEKGAGGWSSEGCKLHTSYELEDASFLDECHCWHLTHFGQMLWNSDENYFNECADETQTHKNILDFLSVMGCIISLVALTGIFLTAIIHPNWLKGAGQKIILQMSVSLAMLLIMFLIDVSTKIGADKTGCLLLGMILHYALLSNFAWMAIAGYLQYQRLVTVLYSRTPKLVFKTAVIGWGLPTIPAILDLVSGLSLHFYEKPPLCLPRGVAFYVTVLAPLTIILAFNAVVFVLIARNLLKMSEAKAHVDKNVSIRRFKQLLFLFILFGLNWMFGLLQNVYPDFRVFFAYLLCLYMPLQGLAYFAYFVLMHEAVIRRLNTYFKKRNANMDSSMNLTE